MERTSLVVVPASPLARVRVVETPRERPVDPRPTRVVVPLLRVRDGSLLRGVIPQLGVEHHTRISHRIMPVRARDCRVESD